MRREAPSERQMIRTRKTSEMNVFQNERTCERQVIQKARTSERQVIQTNNTSERKVILFYQNKKGLREKAIPVERFLSTEPHRLRVRHETFLV